MQQLLHDREGILSTRVGWIGGENDHPTEADNVGHAEAVEVVFDPARTSFRALLEYYFQVHRADLGPEIVGSEYRSAIFHTSEEQRRIAEETIHDVDAAHHWPGRVVTQVTEAGRFWPAGADDQDYLRRFPHGCPPPFPRKVRETEEPATIAPA
jgi:peptide-methionine (S)-S-oxide reductase